jgi:hypothetical protein
MEEATHTKRDERKRSETKQPNPYMAILCIIRFGGRINPSNKKLDENFGRNLSSFIIRYRNAFGGDMEVMTR